MSFFSELWDKVRNWFESIGEDVMDFLEPLAKEIAQNGGVVLMTLAQQAVLAAESSGGSGSDKFEAAKDAIVSGLKAQGLPVVFNAVHASIEAAVAKMKANQ